MADRVAAQLAIPKVQAAAAVEGVLDRLRQAMRRGERIELRGFGVFRVRPRKTGVGRNPRNGQEAPIPPGRTVRFKPSKYIKALNLKAAK